MRHLFVQRGLRHSLDEFDLRGEYASPEWGEVKEASYFAQNSSGFWFWRKEEELVLVPPFDADGRDVHSYFSHDVTTFDPSAETELGAVRYARGKIVCLHPREEGDRTVARDLWVSDAPCWRLTDLVDFGLLTSSGVAIAVCCAMSPLVLARPESVTVGAHLSLLSERALTLLTEQERTQSNREGQRVTLREGDEVEVLGVVCDPERSRKRFDLQGRGGPFRTSYVEPVRWLLGDEPGVRLVLRRCNEPSPRG